MKTKPENGTSSKVDHGAGQHEQHKAKRKRIVRFAEQHNDEAPHLYAAVRIKYNEEESE